MVNCSLNPDSSIAHVSTFPLLLLSQAIMFKLWVGNMVTYSVLTYKCLQWLASG